MADTVAFVAVDWSSGWMHFQINPDNTLTPSGYAQKKDQALQKIVNLSLGTYPPGFPGADQTSLLTLLNKLAREWSKEAINTANVTRVGQIYYETGTQPAP